MGTSSATFTSLNLRFDEFWSNKQRLSLMVYGNLCVRMVKFVSSWCLIICMHSCHQNLFRSDHLRGCCRQAFLSPEVGLSTMRSQFAPSINWNVNDFKLVNLYVHRPCLFGMILLFSFSSVQRPHKVTIVASTRQNVKFRRYIQFRIANL